MSAASQLRGTNLATIRRTLTGTALATAVASLVSLFLVPLVLGNLSLEAYGVWATLSALLAVAGLAEAGIGTEIVRRVAAANGLGDEEGIRRAVHEGTSVLAVLALGIVVLSGVGSVVLPDLVFPGLADPVRDDVPLLIAVVGVLLALDLVVGGHLAVLRGLQRADVPSGAAAVGSLAGALGIGTLVVAGAGIWSLPLGSLVGSLVSWGVQLRALRQLLPALRFRLVRLPARAAATYAGTSAVIILSSVANIVDMQLDKVVLTQYVGAAAAGSYQVGSMLALQAKTIAVLPAGLLLAGVAELGQGLRLRQLLRGVTEISTAAGGVLCGGVVLFGARFVELWLGDGYDEAGRAAQLLALSLLLNCWTAPWWTYCLGAGRLAPALWGGLANMVVNAGVSWPLTAQLGFDGALYGSLAGNAAGLLVFWVLLRAREPEQPWLRPVLVSSAVLAVVAVPVALLLGALPATWLSLVGCTTAWVSLALGSLLLLGRLPLELTGGAGAPRLVLRERT